jgi:transcription elongation factor S-II
MNSQNATTARNNVRVKLFEVITRKELDQTELQKTANNIEVGVYNYAIKEATQLNTTKQWDNPAFQQLYTDRLRTIYLNLKNTKFVERIISGELTPQELAYMTHQEMDPAHWKEQIDAKMKRDASKYTERVEATTDMFTCKKCHSKKCSYYELQTRSADEPTTIFVTCQDCGKHWKM